MNRSNFITRLICCFVALSVFLFSVTDAEAAKKKRRVVRRGVAQSLGVSDPRYSAIIMNPVTGEVYHQQNADAQRYPASLTKMMTLYLLFEALEKKKVDIDDRMEVSEYAARMPQTNLALDPGDRIDVETAIEALVVRSANDVAVVVAEHLAGSVESFAVAMTNKARALGMSGTVFKNPNGLPNGEQHTTARDMAKLGIALKRDFPNYYRYFSTLQFSHNGVTYYTHNRVMLRYAGVDGIKTGYIGASGFNLVTSVTRGGRPLVGVVMGGGSGRWRDDRMITLLDQSYQTISRRGAAKGRTYLDNLPLLPGGKVRKTAGIDGLAAENAPAVVLDTSGIPAEAEEQEDGGANDTLPPVTVPTDRAQVRQETTAAIESPFALGESVPAPTPTVASVAPTSTPAAGFEWGIQVGAFSSSALANQAIAQAQQLAARQLVGAMPAVLGPNASAASPVYRARLVRISQVQAKNACAELIKNNTPCFTFREGR